MKTRDRILQKSRELFNEAGEANVTTVDISDALNISPGNLYYHFKNKDDIVTEIFCSFYKSIGKVLEEIEFGLAGPAELRLQLNCLLDILLEFRFIYQDFYSLCQSHPRIARKAKMLLNKKRSAFYRMLSQYQACEIVSFQNKQEIELLVNNITAIICFWPTYQIALEIPMRTEFSRQGTDQILALLTPYLALGTPDLAFEERALPEADLVSG